VSNPAASSGQTAQLNEAVRSYWNNRIHDLEMTTAPPGSAEFFRELDAYRFEKLDYLPRLVNFDGYRGKRVLEIGCGVGTDLARFARGGALVSGADFSQSAIDLARKNLAQLGLDGDLRLADGAALPWPDASFDLVYCHGVLQYAADPTGIVREAYRVLAVGGEAVFMVYNRRSWLAWMSRWFGVGLEHGDAPALTLYTRSELEVLLAPFRERRIVPERFPVRSRLHKGAKGIVYNALFVPTFRLLPKALVRPLGWHLMAFCRKQ
jgi:SAM-dependent methyltransferase